MYNPYEIVKKFEEEVALYAGSKYAVAVDSCTNALFLCCKYLDVDEVEIPKKTYVSVPCSIIHAGGKVKFREEKWIGVYQLKPYPIYDGAKRFTHGMYIKNSYYCLSFHQKKHINIGRGGMILTNNYQAYKWFKKARFDGREEIPLNQDHFQMLGWNMYITPEQAARGLMILSIFPDKNDDILNEENEFPDLSIYSIYK